MINITYIIIFQMSLICYLLYLLFSERRVIYFGCIIIFFQIFTLFLVIFNRAFSDGFSISFFLYIVIIPVILPYIAKIFAKRNPNSSLKKLAFRFHEHLETSFFSLLFINKGFLYFSRKFFLKNEQFFRKPLRTPYHLKNLFITYPWICFIIFIIFEMLFFKKVYFAAVLLSINVLLYRLFLVLLRIIEYSCVEALEYIDAQFFLSKCEKPLTSFFINFPNISTIMDNNEKIDNKESLLERWIVLFSSITYASSYFSAKVLKKYLGFYYRNLLNCITLVVVLLGWVLENSEKFPFFSTFVPFMIFAIVYLFSKFLLPNKFFIINSLIKHLSVLKECFYLYRDELIQRNFVLPEQVLNFSLSTPYFWSSWKPENFLDYFRYCEQIVIFDKDFIEKPSIFFVIFCFVKKYFWWLLMFFCCLTIFIFFIYLLLNVIFDILCWITLF